MDENQFESWAIVELFGHQRIAGRVSEQQIAGTSLLRVDVPEIAEREARDYYPAMPRIPGYTRFFGAGAIYAINPMSEDLVRRAAESFRTQPVVPFEIERRVEIEGPSTREVREALAFSEDDEDLAP